MSTSTEGPNVGSSCGSGASTAQRLSWENDRGVVHVSGDVDVVSAPQFHSILQVCDDDRFVIALDLTRVGCFSAAGVSCFVERGWLWRPHPIIIASRPVRRVLEVCDLDLLLEAHGWVHDGVAAGRRETAPTAPPSSAPGSDRDRSCPTAASTPKAVVEVATDLGTSGFALVPPGYPTPMIVLGVILIILGAVLSIPILYTIGIILVVIGLVLWVLGAMGRGIGGRSHYY